MSTPTEPDWKALCATLLHESQRYVSAVRHLGGIGQTDADLALLDPTNVCGRQGGCRPPEQS